MGPAMSIGPLFVAAWFPDSPRCGPEHQADCIGGEPIGVLPAVQFGKTGAVVGGGGIRSLAACGR